MQKIGHSITSEDLNSIMKEHDIEKNNYISYYEFKALLLDFDDL